MQLGSHSLTRFIIGKITHVKAKMYYQNFDSQVTYVYRVVIEGWPLSKFSCPSDIGSRTEVQLLYDSWKSGVTRFRKLSGVEWQNWLAQRDSTTGAGIVGDTGVQHDNALRMSAHINFYHF